MKDQLYKHAKIDTIKTMEFVKQRKMKCKMCQMYSQSHMELPIKFNSSISPILWICTPNAKPLQTIIVYYVKDRLHIYFIL